MRLPQRWTVHRRAIVQDALERLMQKPDIHCHRTPALDGSKMHTGLWLWRRVVLPKVAVTMSLWPETDCMHPCSECSIPVPARTPTWPMSPILAVAAT